MWKISGGLCCWGRSATNGRMDVANSISAINCVMVARCTASNKRPALHFKFLVEKDVDDLTVKRSNLGTSSTNSYVEIEVFLSDFLA